MKQGSDEPKTRVTLNVGETEKRGLLAEVARRTIAEGRPVSVAEVGRAVLRAGLEAQRDGHAA